VWGIGEGVCLSLGWAAGAADRLNFSLFSLEKSLIIELVFE
jgi:hypothetical protein